MSGSSPDQILKSFVESYVETYRDTQTDDSFPPIENVVNAIYYGSTFVNSDDSSVPGIAELITGHPPQNTSPITFDLNNPRTPDTSDDITLDLWGSIVYNAVNNTYSGINNSGNALTSADTTSHLSNLVFQEIGTSLSNNTPPINLDTYADVVPLYSGTTLLRLVYNSPPSVMIHPLQLIQVNIIRLFMIKKFYIIDYKNLF